MMNEKRFIIDVEDEFQENAVFFGEEFLCFEDDSESLVRKLNEQQATIEQLQYLCGENNGENTKSRMKISDETWAVIEQMIGITMLLVMVFLVLFLITVIIQLTLGYVIWE